MLHRIKKAVQDQLYNRCYTRYAAETKWQSERYAAFLRRRGESPVLYLKEGAFSGRPGEDREGLPGLLVLKGTGCLVFAGEDGVTEPEAVEAFGRFFAGHPHCCCAYAQEDCVEENGRRHHPWFKPVFSPDTLADSFYPGSLFAVRELYCPREMETHIERVRGRNLFLTAVRDWLEEHGMPAAGSTDRAAGLLDEILFHRFAADTENCGAEPEPPDAENPLSQWLVEKQLPQENFAMEVYRMGVRSALSGRRLVSVIIPSKDNPEVLHTCLRSLRSITRGIGYEIIVVDNGSGPENRGRLEQMAEEEEFTYLYREMEFNFSSMCNLGAEAASCDYLLFLNDDMEIIREDWMLKLYEKAALSHAGAVGAKLLYPDSDLIQHAGVTNLQAGPAHKLLKVRDSASYYHGRNRGVHDMLAVTAACLMVEKAKFRQAGGFYEGIAVSYNDVDLCFALYEKGWYNIQRNDVTLYHHESLSRGDDNLSEDKWERLLREKDLLYRRHPELKGADPFYSVHLAGHFSDYLCNFEYDYERRDRYTGLKVFRGREPAEWSNNCLTVTVEHARKERKLDLTEEKETLWIEGWSYVLGMDNCRYQRCLLLLGGQGVSYQATVLDRYRSDVEEILTEQKHVALAGFTCRIPWTKLRPGSYRIAMLAKDRCSGQKLYQVTDTVFVVEPENV